MALMFSEEEISATVRDLAPADRAQETTLNAEDRVLAALEDGPAYPDEVAEATGLARSTVKNKINALKKAGRVEKTGEVQGQMEQVGLVDSRTRPIKEKSAKSTAAPLVSSSPSNPTRSGDDNKNEAQASLKRSANKVTQAEEAELQGPATSVSGLFANPPNWLVAQLEKYRENPDLHIKPLCSAVAAAVLDDPMRGEDVREEVTRALLGSLKRKTRGEMASFLLEDGSPYYFDPADPAVYLHAMECLRAQSAGEPLPPPPRVFKAIAGARNRRAALHAVWDGGDLSDIWPYDMGALLDRGELQPVSMVQGRELGEPLPDLAEP